MKTLNIKEEIVRALKEEGIVKPTTIQEKAIPLIHEGKDLIGISRTGSGKTATFGVPLLERIQSKHGVQALVLSPTRELANQTSNELKKWSKYLNINIATVFGGVPIDPQVRAISKAEVIVGTPGRVLDHLGRETLDLSRLNIFVLDEADKMVEMGFIEDIERIIGEANTERQILLFGATISSEIDYLKNRYMKNAVVAEAELHVKKDLLKQCYYNVEMNQKFSLLAHLMKGKDVGRAIIFCSKRSTVELVNSNLRAQGIKSDMIHGKMRQNKRLQVIERFNSDKLRFLVASSVAARGLDIQDVTHVFNYDLSQDPQEYIHRVGRTARAGGSGEAVTLLTQTDYGTFSAILDNYDIDIDEAESVNFPKLKFDTGVRRDSGQRNGRSYQGRNGHSGNSRGVGSGSMNRSWANRK
jgi:superfamily II DNA/RNA helicase